ncbi:hypothetical protein E2P81_ATG08558 [Venturia nashicola]|nr:hypothetical protein E2P81_ATG08558 [Venturia nashicola]
MEHLAANIALLGLVTDAPEAPSLTVSTPPRESPTTASLRTIKFKHERLISQNLAFICANSNDPLRIMATCIEEDHPNERLIIRFAANKGTYEELMESMRHIVRILQDESNNMNRATNPESLLRRVLALNRKRILSRLRHKHATSSRKTKNRRSMLDRLGKAAGLLRNSPLSTVRSQEITNQVHGLNKRSEILENMSAEQARSAAADEQILRLVQDIDSFVAKYGADLLLIPNISADWTPGSTSALLDRMGKVSHYVKACNELLTAARRYPIFSHVTSCFVNLQQIRPSRNSNGKSPDNALPKDLIASGTILRLAKRDRKSPADVTQLLSERLGQTSKLHAEIQLLLYYEIHSTALPPRIISSSKKACYLCKLLFELHGKFVVPGSHGHLYDSWKWPSPVSYTNNAKAEIVSLDMLLPRFMAIIEQKIWQGLEKKGKRSDDDCESRVSNGSFTATVVSTSSGASVSTIRASRNVRSATFPSCAQANQNLPTSSSKSDSSERSRSATRHELTMIEMTDLSADKNFQHEIHLPIRQADFKAESPAPKSKKTRAT